MMKIIIVGSEYLCSRNRMKVTNEEDLLVHSTTQMLQCSGSIMNVFGVFFSLAIVVYTYFKWTYSYWARRNLPCIPPTFPTGNIQNPFCRTRPIYFDFAEAYQKLKTAGHKHAGFYMIAEPVYFIIDPDYIKLITIQDFRYFTNRGFYYNQESDPLSANIVFMEDDKWRNMRSKFNPLFTSVKIKAMFQTLLDCTLPLTDEISDLSAKNEALDIRELVSCFTTDVIGSCAYGIDCNSFKNPDAEFRNYGRKAFSPTHMHALKFFLAMAMPAVASALKVTIIDKDVSKFFVQMVKTMMEYRESGNHTRRDLMQLLVELKNQGEGMTINEVAAQAFVFFVAGFETSSTTLTFALYELAMHPTIQNKIREEIKEVLKEHDAAVTYDSLADMKYLGEVIDETLRKYPVAPFITRKCTKTYQVPDTDIIIEKGTRVLISIYGIHHDPEYFPDPEVFIPDRFSDLNKKKIIPFTYIPFGEGPRVCIGARFALMQVKIGIVSILRKFRLRLNSKTPKVLSMDPNSVFVDNKETVYLDAEEI